MKNKELKHIFKGLYELSVQDMDCAEALYALIFDAYELGFNNGLNKGLETAKEARWISTTSAKDN